MEHINVSCIITFSIFLPFVFIRLFMVIEKKLVYNISARYALMTIDILFRAFVLFVSVYITPTLINLFKTQISEKEYHVTEILVDVMISLMVFYLGRTLWIHWKSFLCFGKTSDEYKCQKLNKSDNVYEIIIKGRHSYQQFCCRKNLLNLK